MSDLDLSQLSLNDRIKVNVPRNAKGMIIGKGGSTIKSLREKTGCKIFSPDKSNFFVVSGPSENVETAKAAILEIVAIVNQNKREFGRSNYSTGDASNLHKATGR